MRQLSKIVAWNQRPARTFSQKKIDVLDVLVEMPDGTRGWLRGLSPDRSIENGTMGIVTLDKRYAVFVPVLTASPLVG